MIAIYPGQLGIVQNGWKGLKAFQVTLRPPALELGQHLTVKQLIQSVVFGQKDFEFEQISNEIDVLKPIASNVQVLELEFKRLWQTALVDARIVEKITRKVQEFHSFSELEKRGNLNT